MDTEKLLVWCRGGTVCWAVAVPPLYSPDTRGHRGTPETAHRWILHWSQHSSHTRTEGGGPGGNTSIELFINVVLSAGQHSSSTPQTGPALPPPGPCCRQQPPPPAEELQCLGHQVVPISFEYANNVILTFILYLQIGFNILSPMFSCLYL